MDVMANIEAGKYTHDGPFPQGPSRLAERTRMSYYKAQDILTAQLRADLEAEHGLAGHPKAQLLWNLAYDMGHGYGQAEVAYKYATLAELLK